jgi:hypothetical protein
MFERQRNLTPYLLDLPTLGAYLAQQGFLTKPAPFDYAGSAAERQGRYNEAWLYGYLRNSNKRVTLPSEVEREAQRVASSSWPVSLALAWYYVRRDITSVDSLIRQFADLVVTETDMSRLARYRTEVAEIAPTLARWSGPDTAARLVKVAADCFDVALKSKERVPKSRPRQRHAGHASGGGGR